MTQDSRCIHSFHYLKGAVFDFSMSSSPGEADRLSRLIHYAARNPIAAVGLLSLVVTGAIPVGAFLVYAIVAVVCTVVAAIVLDLALLALGVFCLLLALCVAGCISGGVTLAFSGVYVGYRATVGGLNRAKATLTPATVSSDSAPAPTSSDGDEEIDKNKTSKFGGAAPGLLSTLLAKVLGVLVGLSYHESMYTNTTEETVDGGNDNHSDLCRTSLTVLGLAAATLIMSCVVLVTAYAVVQFT